MENYIMMYEKLPNLVLGFHGCDKSTYEKVLKNHENLKACDNTYDWLGNGDILLRDLDCAVIQQIHQYHKKNPLLYQFLYCQNFPVFGFQLQLYNLSR